MAVIRFDPIWVNTITFASGSSPTWTSDFPLTYDYDGTWGDVPYVGFNVAEIQRLIGLTDIMEQRICVKTSAVDSVNLHVHYSELPYSHDNPIFAEWRSSIGTWSRNGDYIYLALNYANLVFPGPTYHTLTSAIDAGCKGFRLSASSPVVIDDVYIEIEGEFQNHRPTLTRPVGGEVQNLQETIRFRWNHNSLLNQESFELRYRVTGSSSWTTVQEDTNNSYYDLPPNTLTTNEYEWQVRTTSEYDFVSPWSIVQVFNAADVTPSPIFITPIEGETIGISDLHIEWDSIDQDRYEFELLDSDNNIIWSDAKLSTSQEISIDNILENNQSYTLRLRVNQPGNLFSSWTEINISVDYTAPALPILTLTPDKETGSIEVDIHNPPPTGTEPTPTHQELFRRKAGGQWIKLANLLPNSKYVDYTPASGKTYDYRVIVYGDNDTSSTSNIFSGSVEVKYSQLNLTSDLSEIVTLMFNPSISFSENYSVITKSFAGRKKPVAEFGELINQSGAIDFVVDDNTLNRLYEFLERQETLLFRDSRGKKMFVVISDMNVNYHSARMRGSYLYEISLSLTEVYYNEAII